MPTDDRPTTEDRMPDAAAQLQRLYLAGFNMEVFDHYPRHVGVVRDGCIALLEVTDVGLRLVGTPGWRMGELMGVLTQVDGCQVFQAKTEVLDAIPERLDTLRRFREELDQLLSTTA